MFFLAGTPQTSKSIQNPSSEMFSVFLYFFRSDLIRLKLFRLWITLNAIIFSSLVNKRLPFQLNLPSINLVSNQIYHRWYVARVFQIWEAPVGYFFLSHFEK